MANAERSAVILRTPLPMAGKGHFSIRAANRAERVCRAISLIRARPEEAHTVESLASAAALSPYHFNRVFRLVTGIPPAQFLCAMRIDAAKRLLLTSKLSVTEICFEIGYKSLGTFVARFTRLVGVSPGALRRAATTLRSSQLRELLEHGPKTPQAQYGPCNLDGLIDTPDEFQGLIFVGLFDSLMSHATPVRCQLLHQRGHFRMNDVPPGIWRVAAAAIPWSDRFSDMLLGRVLQASGEPFDATADPSPPPLHLAPHAPLPHEPPILPALPLLALRAAQHRLERASIGRGVGHALRATPP